MKKITKGNKEFGNYIRDLREEQKTELDNGRWKRWTRQELAKRTGLTERQIEKIEMGEIVDLRPFLKPLAQVFQLSDNETVELYAVAGYTYPRMGNQQDRDRLQVIFCQINYPASARTALWDFIAFNTYHREVWGHTEKTISVLQDNTVLGANLLRILFDPVFGHEDIVGGKEAWDKDVLRSLRVFQELSFPY